MFLLFASLESFLTRVIDTTGKSEHVVLKNKGYDIYIGNYKLYNYERHLKTADIAIYTSYFLVQKQNKMNNKFPQLYFAVPMKH